MADRPNPPALDPETIEWFERRPYPAPYDEVCAGRGRRVLGEVLGLTQFGVNMGRLEPGAVSSLRHYHEAEDEFVYIVEGRPTLVTDSGAQEIGPGTAIGFPAGKQDGHRLENRSHAPVVYLEVGTRAEADEVHYAEADLHLVKRDGGGVRSFRHKSGEPY